MTSLQSRPSKGVGIVVVAGTHGEEVVITYFQRGHQPGPDWMVYMGGLYVPEDQRHKGVGSALVRRVTQGADAAGYGVSLHCRVPLIGWYESLGFVDRGLVDFGVDHPESPVLAPDDQRRKWLYRVHLMVRSTPKSP